MTSKSNGVSFAEDESLVRELYQSLIESWNKNNAAGFADLFAVNGNAIGFDGSQMNGRAEIHSQLNSIFVNHKVASYVTIIREIRFLSPGIAVLRAVAGMVPPGSSDIMPDRNAIQTLIVEKQQGAYRISLFQNTPAAFHGRDELRDQLSKELREKLHSPK
jgi:uncharacterized protein (TIGR02246 family)